MTHIEFLLLTTCLWGLWPHIKAVLNYMLTSVSLSSVAELTAAIKSKPLTIFANPSQPSNDATPAEMAEGFTSGLRVHKIRTTLIMP